MPELTFRQANLADLPVLQKLNQKIMVNNAKFATDLLPDFEFTSAGEEFFQGMISCPGGCCLLAEEAGELIGYTNGQPKMMINRTQKYFEIDNLGVIPDRKGHGYGHLLLEEIFSWAKDQGYERVYLSCYAKNSEALAFYKKHGFAEIEVGLEREL